MGTETDQVVARLRTYFDGFDGESDRLSKDIPGRVSYMIHRRFLHPYLTPRARVLEIGAGPGTFTRYLATRGMWITVTDLSPTQLADNQRRITEMGLAHTVRAWRIADVRDLSQFDDGAFDLALAYGGPISYVFDDAPVAMRELLRVTRPGGTVLASVMSTLGAHRYYLRAVIGEIEEHGDDVHDTVVRTGDLRPIQPAGHVCQMYRSEQITGLVEHAGGRVVAMSASNWLSLGDPDALARLETHPQHWARFLANETWICRQPGALDGGTHILFAAQHNNALT